MVGWRWELEPAVTAIENQRAPLLRYSHASLMRTVQMANSACCIARDRATGELIGYALGSPLEHHDEMGTRLDVNLLKHNTFFIQHSVVSPCVTNIFDVSRALFDRLFERVSAIRSSRFEYMSALLDYEVVTQGSSWMSTAKVWFLIPNYCMSGQSFAYVSAPLGVNAGSSSRL